MSDPARDAVPTIDWSLPCGEPRAPDRPSEWVERHLGGLGDGAEVLDVACGRGRNLAHVAALPAVSRVLGIDRDREALAEARRVAPGAELLCADLESGGWPLRDGARFDAILIVRYLWRPIWPRLAGMLRAGGSLVHETFAVGNERYGRPRRPDFLLRPGELLDLARRAGLVVVAFEQGIVEGGERPAVVQRIVARRPLPAVPTSGAGKSRQSS